MPKKLDEVAAEVAAGLIEAGIAFSPTHDGALSVVLPGGFGEFEIRALYGSTHGDSLCTLAGYFDWHSHDDPLQLVLDVFAGKCLLIEEYSDRDIPPRKYVTYDLAEFLESQSSGTTYRIFNIDPEELERRLKSLETLPPSE